MRKAIVFVFLFSLILVHAQTIQDSYHQDRILVQLTAASHSLTDLPTEMYAPAPGFGLKALDGLFSYLDGKEIQRAHRPLDDKLWEAETGFNRWFIVLFKHALDVTAAAELFAAQPEVEFARIIVQGEFTLTPNDPMYPINWGHNNTAQFPQYENGDFTGPNVGLIGFDSKAPLAWNQSQGLGSSSVIIAILDTGVDTSHPDLRLVPGYDTYDNDNDVTPGGASEGHGTACAGVAAARGNNNLGVIGIAGGCSVMPLKVAGLNMFDEVTLANALTWARDHGAHIISMSLSFGLLDYGGSPALDNAIDYAYNGGVTLFAATANYNNSAIRYPAKHPKVIAVGAASPSGERKSFTSSDGANSWGSNYGTANQDDRLAVDVMAPTYLPTTDIMGATGYTTTNYNDYFGGTSCATPYAAGVAALIKSKYPSYTPLQIERLMKYTCTDMTVDGGAGWDKYTGYGLVNANAALTWSGAFPQTCQIQSPADGEVLNLNTTNVVSVSVLDIAATSRVEFYLGSATVPVFTDYTSPFSWSWNTTGLSEGSYTIKAKAYSNTGSMAQAQVQVFLLPANACVWKGTSSANWTSASNWHFDNIPTSTMDVIIPAYTPYSPTINFSNQQCRNLEIREGATLSFSTYGLTVNGYADIAGTLTMNSVGYLRVVGTLTFKPGATSNITSMSSEIRAEGNVTFQAGTSFQMSSGKFIMQGSSNRNLVSNSSSVILHRFTINKTSSSVIMSTPGSGTIICASTMTLQAGTLISNETCNVILKSNLTGSGLLQMNSGTIWADGSNVTISLSTSSYLNNVSVLGTGNLSFISNARIKGNIETLEGTLSAENQILTVLGNWLSTNPSHFNYYDSHVIFSGTGDQYIGSVRFNSVGILKSSGNLIIPTGKQVIAANINSSSISGNLQVIGSLTINQGLNLSVTNLTLNGSLTLNSGELVVNNTFSSTTGSTLSISTASLIMNGSYTGVTYGIGGHLIMTGGLIQSTNNGILFGISSSTAISAGTIRVGHGFNAPYPNTFKAEGGIVEFAGARFGSVALGEGNYMGSLLLNKPSNSYQLYVNSNLTIKQDISLNGGEFSLNEFTMKVDRDVQINGGKLTASNAASVIEVGRNWTNNSGVAYFVEGSGTVKFKLKDYSTVSTETFNIVHIDRTGSSGTNLLATTNTTITISGGLSIFSGRLTLSPGTTLKLNNNCAVNITNGGELYAIGSSSNNAKITSDSGYYAFTCNSGSTLAAEHCIFERMDANGIFLSNNSSVDNLYALRNCTFRNGASGGTLIKKFSTQIIDVDNAVFPTNTWNGSYNAYHSAASGRINFYGPTGGFVGTTYENDPNSRIFWYRSDPAAAHTPSPQHNATNVPASTHLGWTYTAVQDYATPVAFNVRIGIDPTMNDYDEVPVVGGVGSHLIDCFINLDYLQTYYWQVVPTTILPRSGQNPANAKSISEEPRGDASGCPIWTFQTMAEPVISSFPYNVDFESGKQDWSSGTILGFDNWEWGTPTQTNLNSAHSGTKVMMTDLDSNYLNDTITWLKSPKLDFSTLSTPRISVWLRFVTEAYYDGMILESSTDNGTSWQHVIGEVGFYNTYTSFNYGPLPFPKWSGNNNAWTQYSTDLAALAYQSSVYLRFKFGVDFSVVNEGFAVDDISVWNNIGNPDPPANLQISRSGGNTILTWAAVSGATSYRIYSASDPGLPLESWTFEAQVTGSTWTDTFNQNKKFYYVKTRK